MDSSDTRSVLLDNGVPELLLDAIERKQSPFNIMQWCKPDQKDLQGLESHASDLLGLCPIAKENGECVIGFLPDRGDFICVYYEDLARGNSAITTLGHGYRQFAANVLLDLESAGLREHLIEARQ